MKFFVTYQMPHSGFDEWMSKPEAERKEMEATMKTDWEAWQSVHAESITETAGVGKPKRITAEGVEDSRNDIMMYSFVEADSIETASEMFKNHPHFANPAATIEVMPVNTDIS